MAYEGILQCVPGLVAGGDLTAKQFHAMKLDGAKEVVDADAGEALIGILQNDPAEGEAASVAYLGVSKVKLGAAVNTVGTRLAANADGELIAATTGDYIAGIALETGAENDLISALILIGTEPIA